MAVLVATNRKESADNVRQQRMRQRRKHAADQESQRSLSAPISRPATTNPVRDARRA